LTAVDGVNLTVRQGQVLVVIGPSGSGKSTVLRCINHLETPTSGEIWVDGKHLTHTSKDLNAVRAEVGMVFQQFNLFPHLTALENIALAPAVVKKQPSVRERARELLTMVGLGDRGGSFPHELSGGQQQRVAIARALAQDPEVMLFDEPTSALDPEMRDEVMRVIRDLAAKGMTMLVVTHEMQFAHDIATRVWVIDKGTIAEDGPPSQVVDDPKSEIAREFFGRLRR
jgi:polar amino acid transport system ATP-binding protein